MIPFLIGIVGSSGSGKTEITKRLLQQYAGASAFSIDSYYKNRSDWSGSWDDPNAIDFPLFIQHMRALLRGESVDIPQYDFTTSSRVSSTTRVSPGAVIIIEGIFVLLPELRHLFDTIIYIETKLDACLDRKIRRDTQSRGRTEAEVRQQSQGDPGFFENYIHAYKGHAGILIDNSTFCNDLDFNMGPIIQEVKSRMDARETYLGTLFMSASKFSLFTQSPLNPEAIKLNGFVEPDSKVLSMK